MGAGISCFCSHLRVKKSCETKAPRVGSSRLNSSNRIRSFCKCHSLLRTGVTHLPAAPVLPKRLDVATCSMGQSGRWHLMFLRPDGSCTRVLETTRRPSNLRDSVFWGNASVKHSLSGQRQSFHSFVGSSEALNQKRWKQEPIQCTGGSRMCVCRPTQAEPSKCLKDQVASFSLAAHFRPPPVAPPTPGLRIGAPCLAQQEEEGTSKKSWKISDEDFRAFVLSLAREEPAAWQQGHAIPLITASPIKCFPKQLETGAWTLGFPNAWQEGSPSAVRAPVNVCACFCLFVCLFVCARARVCVCVCVCLCVCVRTWRTRVVSSC